MAYSSKQTNNYKSDKLYLNNYRQNSSQTNRKNDNQNDQSSFCVVCCQEFSSYERKTIYAIGICDHLVCYYCSTKMRVLCEQNECPICRQELSEVVFTTNKNLKFSKLELKKCIEYNSRFRIYFENDFCLTEFYKLQEFRCLICCNNDALFLNLKELETHLRKEHDLFLCELCVNHLKIFPHERKYYSRKQLILHKKTGDPDNKSYKGHPLCDLCKTLFFDSDELLSHLKRDHYNCHFCDPGRTKMFFNNYINLKNHFLEQHFVCEEGLCKDEEITSAFANKIDLQAHKAQVHSSGKQSRSMVVDLDIDFRESEFGAAQPLNNFSDRNSNRRPNNRSNHRLVLENSRTNQLIPTQEDFPHLETISNVPSNNFPSLSASSKRDYDSSKKPVPFINKLQVAASSTEEFPALATPSTSGLPSFAQKKFVSLKNKPNNYVKKNKGFNSSMQSSNSNIKYSDIASNYPPLQSTSINESWNNPLPTFTQDDFPDMFINVKKTKKKTQYINVKKEAQKKEAQQKEAQQKEAQKDDKLKKDKSEKNQTKENMPKNNLNNETTTSNLNNEKMLSLKVPPGLTQINNNPKIIKKLPPPPGFNLIKNDNFNMESLGNIAKELIKSESLTNNKKKINNGSDYIYSSSFEKRNENLSKIIKQELKNEQKHNTFVSTTDKFIMGYLDGDLYFKKCLELFGKNFITEIFSELLILMPHIKKQNQILKAYERYFNYNKGAMQKSNPDGSKGVWILTNEKIEFLVCPDCQQVLGLPDGFEHMTHHEK